MPREITAKYNYKHRTFTLRTEGNKYRTNQMSFEEFDEALYNTPADWENFLKNSDNYYIVK